MGGIVLPLWSAGDNPLESINALIEIPDGSSVKYELDVTARVILVDRFFYTATHYPSTMPPLVKPALFERLFHNFALKIKDST